MMYHRPKGDNMDMSMHKGRVSSNEQEGLENLELFNTTQVNAMLLFQLFKKLCHKGIPH